MKTVPVLLLVIAAAVFYVAIKFMALYWVVAIAVALVIVYGASVVLPAFAKAMRERFDRLHRRVAAVRDRVVAVAKRIAGFLNRAVRSPTIVTATVGVAFFAPIAFPLVAPSSGVAVPRVYQRMLLGIAPLLVGWTDAVPSYSAFVTPRFTDPQREDDALVVGAGVPTTLRFGISPGFLATSLVEQAPDRRIVGSADDVGLTVKMSCSFCRRHPAFVTHMTYRAKDRSSNFVDFTFVANGEGVQREATPRRLVVSVHHDASGQEYDRISIPVAIAGEGAPRSDNDRLAMAGRAAPSVKGTPAPAADVVLLAYEHLDGQVRVQVQPVRPDLKARIGPLVVDSAGRWREFTTNVRGQRGIEKITTAAYGSVSQIILPPAAPVRRSSDVVVSDLSIKTSTLNAAEAAKIGDVLATTGQELYARLFVEGPDAALSQAIGLLESSDAKATAAAPLTVLIYTDLSLPWQYLMPVAKDVDASRFWGLLFNLEVQRTNLSIPPPREGAVADPPAQLVFAKFAVASDASVGYAQQQIESLRLFGKVEVVESARALVDVFKSGRRNIAAVVAFLHAASAQPTADGGGTAAPRLYFAPKDWIEVREARSAAQPAQRRRDSRRPALPERRSAGDPQRLRVRPVDDRLATLDARGSDARARSPRRDRDGGSGVDTARARGRLEADRAPEGRRVGERRVDRGPPRPSPEQQQSARPPVRLLRRPRLDSEALAIMDHDVSRRHALLALSTLLATSGCATQPPLCADDPGLASGTSPLTIDVHAHVFNGSDLQIKEFLLQTATHKDSELFQLCACSAPACCKRSPGR